MFFSMQIWDSFQHLETLRSKKTALPTVGNSPQQKNCLSNTWKLSTTKKQPFQHLETFHSKKTTFPTLGNFPQRKKSLSNAWKKIRGENLFSR